jgi:uncharacterized damage-inducible protein DinB
VLAVLPDRQGSGIGSRLLDLTESRLRELGATEVVIDTSSLATELLAWYERRGYMVNLPSDYYPAIRQLAEYEVWCNAASIGAAQRLEPAQLARAFPFGLGTIHATLFHTVSVFRTWSGCVGPEIVKPAPLRYDPAMPLPEIANLNAEHSAAFLCAVEASHEAGVLHTDRRIVQVFHLVTHGTHHRAQFITMLRLLGVDPPFEAGDFAGWSRRR